MASNGNDASLLTPDNKSSGGDTCMDKVKRASQMFTVRVLTAAILGITVGIIIKVASPGSPDPETSEGVKILGFPGVLWLRGLQCLVLPMIVSNMICSIAVLKKVPDTGGLAKRAIAFYMSTTFLAACLSLLWVNLIIVGNVTAIEQGTELNEDPAAGKGEIDSQDILDSILNIFTGLVPANLVDSAVKLNLTGLICFSVVVGILIDDSPRDMPRANSPLMALSIEINELIMKMVQFMVSMTPFGVFSLLAAESTRLDFEAVGSDIGLFLVAIICGLACHVFIVYPAIYFIFTKKNPYAFMSRQLPAILTALGTSSSAATLPMSLKCITEKNGVHPTLAKFVMSLGATINMDGTAIGFPIAAIFLGLTEGMDMDAGKQLLTAITATIASVGAAPIPNSGTVLLIMILDTVGVKNPTLLTLIIGLDWLSDRMQTAVNVTGDAFGAGILNHLVPMGDILDANPALEEQQDRIARKVSVHRKSIYEAYAGDDNDKPLREEMSANL